jgi:hypothetical protein
MNKFTRFSESYYFASNFDQEIKDELVKLQGDGSQKDYTEQISAQNLREIYMRRNLVGNKYFVKRKIFLFSFS